MSIIEINYEKIHIICLAFSVKFIEICSFIYSFIISELFISSYSVQDYFWLDRYSARLKAVLERGTVPFAAPLELTHVPTTGTRIRQETVQQWKMSEGLESQWCLFPRRFIKLRCEGQRCIEHWSKGNQCLNSKEAMSKRHTYVPRCISKGYILIKWVDPSL